MSDNKEVTEDLRSERKPRAAEEMCFFNDVFKYNLHIRRAKGGKKNPTKVDALSYTT